MKSQSGYRVARDVNPEAGTHAISGHPAENAAAEAATRKSWKEFPYYAQRYGERGWRFSISDSGWITTLCDLSADEARAQVRWLGGVLGARGMPLYLMERHLEHLHAALVTALPERAEQYQALMVCAQSLRELRGAQIPAERFNQLAEAFDRRVKRCKGEVPNMGVVLVAAVADEKAGIANVVESVESWACDSERFDTVWIDTVKETITAARTQQH